MCPGCGSALGEQGEMLVCIGCRHEYDVKGGIPVLYPSTLDLSHLHSEEHLAVMMKTKPSTGKDAFSAEQWRDSKKEFWSMVRELLHPPPADIVNIGCGCDSSFKSFEDLGYRFVNFDIVHNTLASLQDEQGAKRCVAGDVGHLPFLPESFDFLVCIDVIHHECDNLEGILRSFRTLLKPGGILFLQDPNAWGMIQIWKSVLMPRSLHRFLRSTYHTLKRHTHKPADYEFSTSVWAVKKLLADLGFSDIVLRPNYAYPRISPTIYKIYSALARNGYFSRYHNFNYTITAVKDDG